ncbi:hypothetical protein [Nocardia asteroides]|uniref:hypothetical protein n=1 Tax=Nocardia asteroides TaxID=1824 RepID=UPI001E4E97EE|nr:hypothetical protein [Nocardia asteroides]UGT56393.1 hypothetical protein LTT85_05760 [Nocardia asteroides]
MSGASGSRTARTVMVTLLLVTVAAAFFAAATRVPGQTEPPPAPETGAGGRFTDHRLLVAGLGVPARLGAAVTVPRDRRWAPRHRT